MNLRATNLLDPAVENRSAPLVREGKPSQPTFIAIHGTASHSRALAEKVLARLARPVLHINNKYIGETEKNLNQLLNSAERTGAVLFVDEAETLFGKRGDVKDSHDRYANLETNYLLDLIGSRGIIAILIGLRIAKPQTASATRYRWIDIP
ncbi:MAG: AAA family ATPase [Bryobacterales bacterium]|nr:AAA family ATPase [Bryobacterales bacterium]